MNESVLFTLAEVGVTFAGFSGLVVAFRSRGALTWSRTELRTLWFLIGDSLLVLLFALLPLPLALWGWAPEFIWGTCSALLGSWFFVGNYLVIQGDRRDRAEEDYVTVPVITPIFRASVAVALAIGLALWFSVFDLLVPRGQAVYVLGLIVLMVFAAAEFLFFIGLMAEQDDGT